MGKRFLSLMLAALLPMAMLTGCVTDYNGAEDYEMVKPPVVSPNASGELTFGNQTFSVNEERLTINLQMRSNEVLDLSPLAWCKQLRYLSVNLTVIPHIFYDKLDEPHIAEMPATDLSPLAGLVNLEHLELNVSKIENLSALAVLPNLRSLVLWIDGEVDLAPLTACASLTELALGGRGSVDLTPLSKCGALTSLRVDVYDADWNTPDLSALSGAPALETLSTGASNGLSKLTDVPLRNLVDINDSKDILENLPGLETLEYVEFSDEHLNDIRALLRHESVKQIALEVGAQDIESYTVIKSAEDPLLNSLVTVIPAAQLREFLMRGGASITIVVDKNRTAGVME